MNARPQKISNLRQWHKVPKVRFIPINNHHQKSFTINIINAYVFLSAQCLKGNESK
jgi:hypothetical protein